MLRTDIVRTKSGVLASGRADQLLIVASGDIIDDASWEDHCLICGGFVKRYGPHTGVLSWAPDYAPTAKQRRHIIDKHGDAVAVANQRRLAIVSASSLVRGAITAISWVLSDTMKTRAFAPREVGEAFMWLREEIRFDQTAARAVLADVIHAVGARSAQPSLLG
jgi:hypothetical protein